MANYLKSWITVKANKNTLKYVDSLITKAEERIENEMLDVILNGLLGSVNKIRHDIEA